jgi:hypothetical protein
MQVNWAGHRKGSAILCRLGLAPKVAARWCHYLGFSICGVIALGMVLIAERGRLFHPAAGRT